MAQLSLLAEPIIADNETLASRDSRYTPAAELSKVVAALGEIGLDPTSNSQKSVPALAHITAQEDCFFTDWGPLLRQCPTVFMNPPYSNTRPFLERLAYYLDNGQCHAAITLTLAGVLANKGTQAIVKRHAIAAAFPEGRINFVGGKGSNDRDVVYILWGVGADVARFRRSMGGLFLRLENAP